MGSETRGARDSFAYKDSGAGAIIEYRNEQEMKWLGFFRSIVWLA